MNRIDPDTCKHFIVRFEPIYNTRLYAMRCIDCGKTLREVQNDNVPKGGLLNMLYEQAINELDAPK